MYKIGDRLIFVWRKPYKGTTPGIITNIKKYKGMKDLEITVAWDDNTVTRTSPGFLNERTLQLNSERIH